MLWLPDRLMISVWEAEKEFPRGVRSRISRSWEYVMLHGKGCLLQLQIDMRSQKRQKHGSLWNLLWSLPKERSPSDTSAVAQEDPFWASDHQSCKIMHLGCFKPLSSSNVLQQPWEARTLRNITFEFPT